MSTYQSNQNNNPNYNAHTTNRDVSTASSSAGSGVIDLCEIVLCVLLPPLGVLLVGLQTNASAGTLCKDVLLNILLLFFLWIPAVIHAIYVFNDYKYYHERPVKFTSGSVTDRSSSASYGA